MMQRRQAAAARVGADGETALAELQRRVRELEADNHYLTQTLLDVSRERDDYRGAFDTASVGHCVLDARGRILAANAAAAQILGVQPWDCEGRTLPGLFSGPGRAALLRLLHQVGWEKRRCPEGVDLHVPDGKTIARVRVQVLRGSRDPSHRLATLENITEASAAGPRPPLDA